MQITAPGLKKVNSEEFRELIQDMYQRGLSTDSMQVLIGLMLACDSKGETVDEGERALNKFINKNKDVIAKVLSKALCAPRCGPDLKMETEDIICPTFLKNINDNLPSLSSGNEIAELEKDGVINKFRYSCGMIHFEPNLEKLKEIAAKLPPEPFLVQ